MSERTSMPADTRFAPNAAIEAAIQAKIEAAEARGVNLAAMTVGPEDERQAAFEQIGCTSEEKEYMTLSGLYRTVQIAVGERVVQTLNANCCRVARKDLIPSLEAYFEAVDAGELVPVTDDIDGPDALDASCTEAELACNELEERGFLTAVIWSGQTPPEASVVFERQKLDPASPDAVSLMDTITKRFQDDQPFMADLIGHCVSMGAAYRAAEI